MQDLIVKGTGDSRYLKSVANFLSLYPSYEDFAAALIAGTLPVDFNGINSAGITQSGTPYAKSTVVDDNTAALWGLGSDATAKTVFDKIHSTLNAHRWRRRTKSITMTTGAQQSVSVSKPVDTITGKSVTVWYGDDVSYDDVLSQFSLVNEQSITVTGAADGYWGEAVSTLQSTLRGKYIREYYDTASGLQHNQPAYVAADSSVELKVILETYFALLATATPITGATVKYGEWQYLESADINSYPLYGESGGYEYEYLGYPLANAKSPAKIAIGSYVGTGGTAQGTPVSLTTDFAPKMLFVSGGKSGVAIINGDSVYNSLIAKNRGNETVILSSDFDIYGTTYHYAIIG